jgi:hypothetical protein
MSDLENKGPSSRPVVTPSEFVEIVQGTASPEIRSRFLDACNDPTSELHELLLGMEEWSRSLPGAQRNSRELHSMDQQKKFAARLEHVELFVRQKHAEHVLTANEVDRVFAARGQLEPQSTSIQLMAAIARTARMLDEVHPELHAELVLAIQKREASRSR